MYGNGDWETIRACHEKSMREAMGEVLAERKREKEERETKGRDASQGRRHSQQHQFQSLLPFPVAGEGQHGSNRSRSSAVAPALTLAPRPLRPGPLRPVTAYPFPSVRLSAAFRARQADAHHRLDGEPLPVRDQKQARLAFRRL